MAKKTQLHSGRSGASATQTPSGGYKGFREPSTPKGWANPAISVRSGEKKSTVYVKSSTSGMTPGFKQSNDTYRKAPKGTKIK